MTMNRVKYAVGVALLLVVSILLVRSAMDTLDTSDEAARGYEEAQREIATVLRGQLNEARMVQNQYKQGVGRYLMEALTVFRVYYYDSPEGQKAQSQARSICQDVVAGVGTGQTSDGMRVDFAPEFVMVCADVLQHLDWLDSLLSDEHKQKNLKDDLRRLKQWLEQ